MSTTHEWHLALAGPWSHAVIALGVGCAALAVVITALGLWREGWDRKKAVLLGLRVATALMALVLFLQPTVQFQDVTRVPNRVAVLVDDSESMSLGERAGEPTRAARAAALLAGAAPAFAKWRGEHRVDFYSFGRELSPATEEGLAHGFRAAAQQSDLGGALQKLGERIERGDLGGVVVISDGIDNGLLSAARAPSGGLGPDAVDLLRGLRAPVHTVWTGKAGLRDLAITAVLADDFAFARNVVKVEVVLRIVGVTAAGWRGRTITVTLRKDGQPLRSASVVVGAAAEQQHKLTFEFTPDRVGKYIYELATPVLDGEAIADNNTRTFLLNVVRDKIRVLQVAGRPSWDERFLRGLLKHDPNVDLISFFILRTPTDIDPALPDELSLIPFPTEELFEQELRSFDVIFLQNFNFAPYGIEPYLGEIRRYVEEGGGLAMIGGDLAFTSGGYAHTPVADVLPVELLEPASPEQLVSLDPFALQPSAEGRLHPILALGVRPGESQQLLAGLPPLEGCNRVARARPGATVLATHPQLQGSDGRPLPILAVADVGKGRSLALMSDSSWRWGFGAPSVAGELGGDEGAGDARGRLYQRFWQNAMRWLIRDPELRLVRVEAERTEFAPGDKVRAVVRVREPDYQPAREASVVLTLTRSGAGAERLAEQTLRTDEQGQVEVDLGTLAVGGYRVQARRTSGGGVAAMNHDEDVFVVRRSGQELGDVEARSELLQQVAAISDGRFSELGAGLEGLSFVPPRVVKVSRFHDRELWSTWLSLLAAAALLTADWALRRRWGLG